LLAAVLGLKIHRLSIFHEIDRSTSPNQAILRGSGRERELSLLVRRSG
jgi:hypothetical protein